MEDLNLKGTDVEVLLRVCIENMQEEVCTKSYPEGLADVFRGVLLEATAKVQPGPDARGAQFPLLAMMLEELTRTLSKVVVVMAATTPCNLRKAGKISNEQESLLRRGLEDALLGLAVDTLKAHVLTSHLDFTEFQEEKERG